MAPMPALRLPANVKTLLPKVAAGLLLIANLGYLMSTSLKSEAPQLWKGPVMSGKLFPLPERPLRAMEKTKAEAGKKDFAANEPLKDVMEEEKARKAGAEPKPAERIALDAMPKEAFIVQAGSFVLKLGAETLLDRLRKNGLQPQMVEREEMVQLNDVQAGPYPTLEEAKVSEVKLKADGLSVKAVETWEGYIITLGKFYMLGYAVEMMERAEKMKIAPLRMVKVESAIRMYKVVLGPFNTKESAKQVSVRVSQLGMAVPVIKTVADEDKETAAARKLIEENKAAASEKAGKEKASKAEPAAPAKGGATPATAPASQAPAKPDTAKASPAGEQDDDPSPMEGESVEAAPAKKAPEGQKNAPKTPLPQGKG